MVASGWVALSLVPSRLRRNWLDVASLTKQQKIRLFYLHACFSLSYQVPSTLAMFDELAQDEEDAEDYDLESLEHRTAARGLREDDDTATLVGSRVGDDAVVFEIGDEDGAGSDDEDAAPKKRRGEQHEGDLHEREGLMRDD